jgi:hypothetical protein
MSISVLPRASFARGAKVNARDEKGNTPLFLYFNFILAQWKDFKPYWMLAQTQVRVITQAKLPSRR